MTRIDPGNFMINKVGVKRSVVRDQNSIIDEFQPARDYFREQRGLSDHFIINSRQRGNKSGNGNFRIYKREKTIDYLLTANSVFAQLDDAIGRHFCSGCFHVDYDKVQVLKQARFASVDLEFNGAVFSEPEAAVVSDAMDNPETA